MYLLSSLTYKLYVYKEYIRNVFMTLDGIKHLKYYEQPKHLWIQWTRVFSELFQHLFTLCQIYVTPEPVSHLNAHSLHKLVFTSEYKLWYPRTSQTYSGGKLLCGSGSCPYHCSAYFTPYSDSYVQSNTITCTGSIQPSCNYYTKTYIQNIHHWNNRVNQFIQG